MNENFRLNGITPELLFGDGMEVDDQKVWTIVIEHNILMEIDRETGKMTPCGFIPTENKKSKGIIPYRFLFKYGDRLVLLPYDERDICIYDIEKKIFERMELDMTKLKENTVWRCTGYEKIDNEVVVYSGGSLILIVNLPAFDIKYIDLKEKLPENIRIDTKFGFWEYSYLRNNELFLVPVTYPCVFKIDIYNKNISVDMIPEENSVDIDNPVFDKSILYYFNRKDGATVTLTKYDLKSLKFEKYDLGIERVGNNRVFGFMTCINNILWMLPGECGEGYRFYTLEGRLDKINELPVVSEDNLKDIYPREYNYRNGILTEEGHILTIHAWSCQLIDIDTVNESINMIPIIKSDSEKWAELCGEILDNSVDDIYREWIEGMLKAYLTRVGDDV